MKRYILLAVSFIIAYNWFLILRDDRLFTVHDRATQNHLQSSPKVPNQ
jgi:hypothetical protein